MVILLILAIIILIIGIYMINHTNKINNEVDKRNKELSLKNKKLYDEYTSYYSKKAEIENEIRQLETTKYNTEKQMQNAAFNYSEMLEAKYTLVEKEFDNNIEDLKNKNEFEKKEILDSINKEKDELNKIKATRIAAQQAILREKEIKEKLSFYCLPIDDIKKDDISILESIKPKLANKRILCMLIWQTFWQKPLKVLCNNVYGTKSITGIYKITNIETNECYIGQAVDVQKRITDHVKAGLGIDTPPGNKLYSAMKEYGIWNFSFELLEECKKEELNEKERYYIDLYDSSNFGYNILKGVS